MNPKKLLQYGGLILLGAVILGYSLWRGSDVLFGIRLHVTGLQDGQAVTNPILPISGEARHAIGVSVDGREVTVSKDGTWRESVMLLPGYNEIHISAADKFGKTVSDHFAVYYRAPEQPPEDAVVIETATETTTPQQTALLKTAPSKP